MVLLGQMEAIEHLMHEGVLVDLDGHARPHTSLGEAHPVHFIL